ncbi:MAG: M1 family metallopeptidase [Bacteroidetes bacterium]|nr:M1 family metallopeptidase [Bacteroidota bacterium]
MNKAIYAALLGIILTASYAFSQDIYMPVEFRKALANNTRTTDGQPGPSYWQNYSDYFIDAEVNTFEKILKGTEKITYHNKSPFDLTKLVIRLYQDFSRPGKSRDWETDPKDFSDGVTISRITINGITFDPSGKDVTRPGTNMIINLGSSKIMSGTDNAVEIDWSFKIPEHFPRMGMYDSTSYMVAYWYPQIAVYDDIDGWDMIDYKGVVEFYNDISNFDVRLKTDRPNLIVWSTGILQNPGEVFTSDFLPKYNDAQSGSTKLDVDCSKLDASNQITKNNGRNTWHIKAESVPDFAFAVSDHYDWQMKKIETAEGHYTNLNTAFRPGAVSLKYDVLTIAEKTIQYLSTVMPGVPFPYPSMTVFNGEGGMEFPMMVNDGDEDDWGSLIYLTSHEISHTYFPFYMGINERKYAWMDEGFAVFLPIDFQTKMNRFAPDNATKKEDRQDQREYITKGYLRNSGTMNDIPMLAPSNHLSSTPYRFNAYAKSTIVYETLQDMLGEDLFAKTIREFIGRWNGKHPTPYDFFFTFNNFTGKDLNWFWRKWYMEYGVPDLSISAAMVSDKKMDVKIKNKGGMPVPVAVTITYEDGSIVTHNRTAEVWKSADEYRFTIETTGKVKTIVLGNKYIPDVNPEDNAL